LMIDDDAEFLGSMQKLLELYGYDSDIAVSGSEAIRKLSLVNYDLVISDVMMPMIGGFEILERVKNTINQDIPVILVTGEKICAETVIKAINLGVADFIQKPFYDYQIIKAIIKQKVRMERADHHKNCHLFVVDLQAQYEFSPLDYININIPDLIISQYAKCLSPSIRNELMMCLEEMVSNAFIHGIFKLGAKYKELNSEEYNQEISQMLLDPEVSDKLVSVHVFLEKTKGKVSISVTDPGSGFNFAPYILKEPGKQTDRTEVPTHELFRGLSLIQVLADKTTFLMNGRMIRIEKNNIDA